jgi:hypothetical protein
MQDVQLAIKALAQQFELEGCATTDAQTKRDCDRMIFALELLSVRCGFERLEVDLELARVALEVSA